MRKQVVFIMTDTTRFDMLGCYGNPDMKTPNLDELAKESVKYERTYTCQPVCEPARSSIFTGLYPHSNGAFTNSVPLFTGVKTIGDYLKPAGIHSTYIGKWHLDGGDYFGNGICPKGYDPYYWYDMRCYLNELTPEERKMSRQESTSLKKNGITEDFTFAHRCSNRALDFLEKYTGEDFFLTVSYDEPHQPYLCPEPYASLYKNYEMPKKPNIWDTLDGKPELQKLWAGNNLFLDKDSLKIEPRLFFGCNSFVDYEIGRVLDAVKKFAPDAMVIYTSDHGEALMAHSLSLKGPSVYEEITHVPLIIKGGANWPSAAGTAYPSVTSHIDLVPTILDYYGLPIPSGMPGKSMRPIIYDQSRKSGNHPAKFRENVFIEFHRYEIDHDGFGGFQPMRAIVTDTNKLAIYLLDSTDELYDTKQDPDEMKNLINESGYKKVRDSLHQKILKFMNETRDPYRGYQWQRRTWNKDEVKPDWEVDGYTRQKSNDINEGLPLDYDTGLPVSALVRRKYKNRMPAGQIPPAEKK
ncbi:MAG: sulfatase-like hydrolase/transferase [Treponema sp.]|jgi:uncharacterized sulfatase|nr:sulfatase-like hydrolase/transferase [Treponema sp.]